MSAWRILFSQQLEIAVFKTLLNSLFFSVKILPNFKYYAHLLGAALELKTFMESHTKFS